MKQYRIGRIVFQYYRTDDCFPQKPHHLSVGRWSVKAPTGPEAIGVYGYSWSNYDLDIRVWKRYYNFGIAVRGEPTEATKELDKNYDRRRNSGKLSCKG